jgi:5-methyltetrahydrofolate--homocysteine methyltransferase
MSELLETLSERVLLCDGAMGSRVQALDLDLERDYWGRENCTEVLNLSQPDLVIEIHKGYFAAGADMVETNSFGGSPITLGEFELEDRAFEINQRAAEHEARARWGPARACLHSATSTTTRWSRRLPCSAPV